MKEYGVHFLIHKIVNAFIIGKHTPANIDDKKICAGPPLRYIGNETPLWEELVCIIVFYKFRH